MLSWAIYPIKTFPFLTFIRLIISHPIPFLISQIDRERERLRALNFNGNSPGLGFPNQWEEEEPWERRPRSPESESESSATASAACPPCRHRSSLFATPRALFPRYCRRSPRPVTRRRRFRCRCRRRGTTGSSPTVRRLWWWRQGSRCRGSSSVACRALRRPRRPPLNWKTHWISIYHFDSNLLIFHRFFEFLNFILFLIFHRIFGFRLLCCYACNLVSGLLCVWSLSKTLERYIYIYIYIYFFFFFFLNWNVIKSWGNFFFFLKL